MELETNIISKYLFDLKGQILSEEISYQFYEKAVNSVEFIGPQKQFKEMMWEEFNHVWILREEYIKHQGKESVEYYDPEKHGGLAMPSKIIDTEVVLDIGIKEELASISQYEALLKKYKGYKESTIFEDLLNDEKKHLAGLEEAQIIYISTRKERFGVSKTYETYRFTPLDLQVIDEAFYYVRNSYMAFLNEVKRLHIFDFRETILSIVEEERGHVEALEKEFMRLKPSSPHKYEASSDNQTMPYAQDTNTKDILNRIMEGEKDRLIHFYDWSRKSTNSCLRETICRLMDEEYGHIKKWLQIEALMGGVPKVKSA